MGKRSSFERRDRDFYRTPAKAIQPLLAHLQPGTTFCEPCAGDGALIDHLQSAGHLCARAFDIEPGRGDVGKGDARADRLAEGEADCFITNPPWARPVLHAIIENLAAQAPAWLLFDADWIHTRRAAPFIPLLRRIVSVGRLKWIEDSPFTGKDNCAWHLFDARTQGPAEFYGRLP